MGILSGSSPSVKRDRHHGRHRVRLMPDPDGSFIPEWELEASARSASRRIHDPRLADWTYRVFGDIYDRSGGFMVYDARSGTEDSWHLHATDAESRKWALRDAQYELLRADDARHSEWAWALRATAPPDDEDDPRADISGADLDSESGRPREDWEIGLLADMLAIEAAEEFMGGDESRFEIAADLDWDPRSRELFEGRETERVVRRSGATRIDAEEEARMYGGF